MQSHDATGRWNLGPFVDGGGSWDIRDSASESFSVTRVTCLARLRWEEREGDVEICKEIARRCSARDI